MFEVFVDRRAPTSLGANTQRLVAEL